MTVDWSIDPTGRHLRRDGQPWFLLADTAWELPRRLTADETEHYLRVRAEQGFTTILTVALSEFADLDDQSPGTQPFVDGDLGRPDQDYWQRIDRVVGRANAHGLTVGLLPAWGRYWADAERTGRPYFDPDTARRYGSWIADRYADADLFWVLGGDRSIAEPGHRTVIDAFAAGLRSGSGPRRLIAFHPRGHESSSDALADADWLDLDMVQSGHTGWDTPNYQLIEQDYERLPTRPVLDSEPNYENSPVMTPALPSTGLWTPLPHWRFDEHAVRRAAYQAVFAGACGHVYGCHDVWQFHDPDRNPTINHATTYWKDALRFPGAEQLRHLVALSNEVDLLGYAPDQSLLSSGVGFLGSHQRAMRRTDAPAVVVYAPGGREVRLDLTRWTGRPWTARWFDLRTGGWSPADDVAPGRGVVPHPFPGQDAVLHLAGPRPESP